MSTFSSLSSPSSPPSSSPSSSPSERTATTMTSAFCPYLPITNRGSCDAPLQSQSALRRPRVVATLARTPIETVHLAAYKNLRFSKSSSPCTSSSYISSFPPTLSLPSRHNLPHVFYPCNSTSSADDLHSNSNLSSTPTQTPSPSPSPTPSPTPQSPPPPHPPNRTPDFHANVGTVIDTLRADYPHMLTNSPDLHMFRDDMVLSDGNGNQLAGKDAYRTVLFLLRAHARLFLTSASLHIVSMYYHEDSRPAVHVRWRMRATPRVWASSHCNTAAIVDGMSVYYLDCSGHVTQHAFETRVRNGPAVVLKPVLRQRVVTVYGTFELRYSLVEDESDDTSNRADSFSETRLPVVYKIL